MQKIFVIKPDGFGRTNSVTANNLQSVTSQAVYNSICFRRTFDNTSLQWSESDIKQGVANIINFYRTNPKLLTKELSGKSVIIYDRHQGDGSGCLILTDNGAPYFEGLYFTWYTNNLYLIKSNTEDVYMYKFAGTYIG